MNHNSHIAHQLVWMFCSRKLNNRINKLHESSKSQILYKDLSTFVQLLSRDKATTLHNRNLQHLPIEMYKLKNNISPHSLIDFISIKETNYDLRKKADFV